MAGIVLKCHGPRLVAIAAAATAGSTADGVSGEIGVVRQTPPIPVHITPSGRSLEAIRSRPVEGRRLGNTVATPLFQFRFSSPDSLPSRSVPLGPGSQRLP